MDSALLDDRLSRVRETVADACARVDRDPRTVRLVAITKGHSAEVLRSALEHGLQDIGENRVGEAREKFGTLRGELDERSARRHMVGHLQRNKARDAVRLFDWIQSIDSLRLAREVSRRLDGDALQALVQVNAAREERKHGFDPSEVVERALEIADLGGIEVRGLMTMAPWTDDEGVLRATFATARALFEELRRRAPGARLDTLSMGMSSDYPVAIEEGATMIRLGTALFGERRR